MKPELDPQPYLLYETLEMLFKYVNGISFVEIRTTLRKLNSVDFGGNWARRMQRLQEIMEDCCRDLDTDDEDIQYFFRRIGTGCVREFTSLARVMTLSFLQFRHHDLLREAQALKDYWATLQRSPYQIASFGVSGLEFRPLPAGATQQSLFMQLYVLDYPADFKLELLKILQDYDTHLDWLLRVITPYAARLRRHLEQEPWLMQTTVDYWREEFQTSTPEAFLGSRNMLNRSIASAEHSRVCFSLMHCSELFWDLAGDRPLPTRENFYVFGCSMWLQASIHRISGDVDRLCTILRTVSDRNKIEILRKLSQSRSYCQKLAEELHCDKGNLSRSLAVLHSYGFLIQEPEQARLYYHTDTEAVEAFLEQMKFLLTGKF